jgi:hypothetical protein
MPDGPSESAIVRVVSEEAARQITRKVIAALQRMTDTLSGDDSGLKTIWDEICAQVQYEKSFHSDAYDETVRKIVLGNISTLKTHERDAMWLQTDEGIEWDCKEQEDREGHPVCDDQIVEWLIREHVYAEAGNWSNVRIRAYIERP